MAEESLDEILSSATPSTETLKTEATTEQPPATTEGAVRDEHGRFAPKAPAPPEAAPQTPATTETERSGYVPQEALHESRRKEQEQRERADRFEQALLARAQPATPVAPPEPVKPPDFWEGPDKYVEHALTPIQQQMQQQKEIFSQRLAIKEYGADAVNAARNALGEALGRDPSLRPLHQRIMASFDPYEDLVQWHKQVTNQQRIGSDPDAFVKAEIDKMISDPTKAAELLARLNGTAAPAAQGSTPSNITRLPPSLSRLPGGNATPVDPDESLESIIRSGRSRA